MTIPLPRRLPRLAALAAMAVVLPLAGAATSDAAWDTFNCNLQSGTRCTGDRHPLRTVIVYSDTGRVVGAAGSYTTSNADITGVVAWADGWSCKYFDGSRTLYPIAINGGAIQQYLQNVAEYGSGSQGC